MKKTASLILILILTVSTLFSFTSCLGDIGSVLKPFIDAVGNQGSENENGNNNNEDDTDPPAKDPSGEKPEDGPSDKPTDGENGNQPEQGGQDQGGDNTDTEAEPPEYYPGSDSVVPEGQAKAFLSVVSIVANHALSYGRNQTSVGSGVIYKLDKSSGDAYVITNYHVVFDKYATTLGGISTDISLYLYGMSINTYKLKATYVGGSLTQDLAVLKVEGSDVLKNSSARGADIGDSDKLSVLDPVIAIGNPEGYGISVTKGIVSVESESLEMVGADGATALNLRVIRVDAAINEGNSGGGLFDENGDLVGIVNAKRTGSEVDNIGYAIPISFAKNFAENIIHYCDGATVIHPSRCLMGITVTTKVLGLRVDETTGKLYKVEIVEIAEFTENSVASDALRVGDRITSISVDGVKRDVERLYHVTDHMLTARVGSTVTLDIIRDGETMTVSVEMTEDSLSVFK